MRYLRQLNSWKSKTARSVFCRCCLYFTCWHKEQRAGSHQNLKFLQGC